IRAILDPISNKGIMISGVNTNNTSDTDADEIFEHVKSRLVDPQNGFMSILSNTLMTSSGWPDYTADTFTSTEGRQREQWSMYDGPLEINDVRDLSFTFKNIAGNVIVNLFYLWVRYGLGVYNGKLWPWPDSLAMNEK